MRQTRLAGEPAEYTEAREELRQAEIELMRRRERVAELRRGLPPGPAVDDYVFGEGPADLEAGDEPARSVRLSELFSEPGRDLIVYHFMFGKQQKPACPMCTMWIDGFNGIVDHVTQNVDFAVVAAAELPELRAYARDRQWTNLRLLSAGASTFKYDLGSEDADGSQDSTVSVFTRDEAGAVRHVYSVHPRMAEDIDQRGIDLLTPVWHLLDLTPKGRGDWFPALRY
ncbi:DUF899 family protein [Streptomyces tubercidicus]|uniref:DUF899 family protein n=1 Tax=Streptomyces tubercidicus TaxID=47759 RepID=UPI002E12EDE9|nr:DUF899 domain-containing protein [Streptomyces tubercidicus]WSX20432.1 DUF899 domain-containing protein [Streptomyces tubercidicus]